MNKTYYDFTIDYFQDEDGVFIAVVPALPGCLASGTTLEEAFEAAKEAIESCLQARVKSGMSIPDNPYSGKNVYRLAVSV